MPRSGGPKSRPSSKTSRSWSTKSRKPFSRSRRPALGLKAMVTSVRAPSSVHRFTRWASTQQVDLDSAGGANIPRVQPNNTGEGTSQPITVSSASTPGPNLMGFSFAGSVQFMLTDLPAVSDFTSLFDHYTIEQVDVEVDCLQNTAQLQYGGNSGSCMPSIIYVPDFDDAALPATGAALAEYQRAKTWTFKGSGKPLKFSIKPRTALTVYRTGVTSAYAAGPESTSLNLAYNDVPHYGIKFWLDNVMPDGNSGTGGSGTVFRVKMKYHLKFLDPK